MICNINGSCAEYGLLYYLMNEVGTDSDMQL